jgi:hypothetical protein
MSVVRDFPEEKVVSDVEDLEIREVENGGWEIFGEVVVAEMKKINKRMSWGWIFESEGKRGRKIIKTACDAHLNCDCPS